MTADELEKWLKGSASKETGWPKDDGSGESVGHERQVTLASSLPMKSLPQLVNLEIPHQST